ncbi:hypothetical protein AB0E10_37925 [Streptomyces sp. NPDC048045]|uniref:hypothetical protein n=1 Tax=Streptomyces sp. NPDC048045 TaxID=3154710 RepID=UPI00342BEBA0
MTERRRRTSTIRTEVNTSICRGIHDRMSAAGRAALMRLPDEDEGKGEGDGTTQFPRLPPPPSPARY